MTDISSVDVSTIAGGAFLERANDALKEVIANVLDPNTDPKAARKVLIEIKVKPFESRETCEYDIICKNKLAPAKSVGGILFIGFDGKRPVAWEKDPKQTELNLNKAKEILKGER